MAFVLPLVATLGAGAAGATAAGAAAGLVGTGAALTAAQTVGLGLLGLGTASSLYGSYTQGKYTEALAKNNAKFNELQARDAEARGVREEDIARINIRRTLGTQRARYGASGVQLGSGSPEDVLMDTIDLGEMDVQTIRNNAAREAFGYRTQAWGEKVKGKAAKRRMYSEMGNTLLTSGADAYGIYKGI